MYITRFMTLPFAIMAMLFSLAAFAADKVDFNTEPVTNQGKRWRIGYYEGGAYIDYQQTLVETIRGLMQLGWIQPARIPVPPGEQTRQLWQWLATEAESDYLRFVPEAHYSAQWDAQIRESMTDTIIKRLQRKRDIDLMIAMGTWAGQSLANNQHQTSTMVLSSSNPLSAGIIASVEDSGYDHVHARVDPYLYERQVRIFHDITDFERLGVAYEDTVSGRSYAAIEAVESVAQVRGFSIERCHTISDISDLNVAADSVKDCFRKLVKTADAIYVTQQGGVNSDSIPQLVELANRHHIPTFSQSGSHEVRKGFLVSLSHANFRYVGRFHAETFAKVFNGAKPNELEQLFEEPPKVAINLRTAEEIGFIPPLMLLGAVDEIYREIEQAE